MDIKIPSSLLFKHLRTEAPLEKVVEALTLCGPTVDRVEKIGKETVLEIEAITNRVDTASVLGVAREAAAILPEFGYEAEVVGMKVVRPDEIADSLSLDVQIMDQSLVNRLMVCVVDGVRVESSSEDIAGWLTAAGMRQINNVIDITNYLTLVYGQPCHAFDYDKMTGKRMVIRESRKGEKLTTLDGKTHILGGRDIVMEDGEGRLVDLCGIMGGELSAVDEKTTRVIWFVQNYEPKHIRKTSLYLQQRTLAAQIFEKSPDIEMVETVFAAGLAMLQERSGARLASKVTRLVSEKIVKKEVFLAYEEVAAVAGVELLEEKIVRILQRLGFGVSLVEGGVRVLVPSFRVHDINIKEDLIEEVLRVYGYFRLPSRLPVTQLENTKADKLLRDEMEIKSVLSTRGYNEVFNYSLTSKKTFEKVHFELSEYINVSNPLSEDFEIMRTSLLPQLIECVVKNQGKAPMYRFFELSNIYRKTDDKLYSEISTLGIVADAEYLELKGLLEALSVKKGWSLSFSESKFGDCFEQEVVIFCNGIKCGRLGILHRGVLRQLGIESVLVAAELNFLQLSEHRTRKRAYRPIPTLTPSYLDVTVQSERPVGEMLSMMREFDKAVFDVRYLGCFEKKKSFRVYFYDQGLVEAERAQRIVEAMVKELGL